MKKGIAVLVCLGILLGMLVCAQAEETAIDAGPNAVLVVGSTTPMSGDFFTDMWGNNTSDIDLRSLIYGYNTVVWNGDGNYEFDKTVVKDVQMTTKGGNRTYRFTLQDGLEYNDGTPITAKDYVFSALLISDPRMTRLGAVPSALQQLVGFEKYVKGVERALELQAKAKKPKEIKVPFAGIRLISDMEFSLTVQKSYLPYFYELALVSVQPYPMGVLAPECDVKDSKKGAYLEGDFTREMLEKTVLDPVTGYRFHPAVTSGPYSLVSYDAETHVAVLEKNPLYKGNFEGQKPIIEKLVYQYGDQMTLSEDLQSGKLDLLHKVTNGDKIEEGISLVTQDKLNRANYPRTGLAQLSFACEKGVTSSVNVRKAIALCVDVETLCTDYLKGYGMPVYGYYGLGQWMVNGETDKLMELARYSLNLNAAKQLLIEDGWNLGPGGGPYQEAMGGTRYRKAEDGRLEELTLTWARPEGSDAVVPLSEMLEKNCAEVGIRLVNTDIPFAELLQHYYRQIDRGYDMFFMASNFTLAFDPYYAYNTADEYQGVFNTTGLRDKKLMKLAENMRKTAPEDLEGYREKWFRFQERWVELLPTIPLYSNIYFDFFRRDLQDYKPNSNWSWANAILYARVGEPSAGAAIAENGETQPTVEPAQGEAPGQEIIIE